MKKKASKTTLKAKKMAIVKNKTLLKKVNLTRRKLYRAFS